MVLVLAAALDVPLRERNALLMAAGFAPAYRETGLDAPTMGHLSKALDFILDRQDPFPAMVVDRGWDVMRMNGGATRLMARLLPDPTAVGPRVTNSIHVVFHPCGLRRWLVNWEETAASIVERLQREIRADPEDEQLRRLLRELLNYPGVPSRPATDVSGVLFPLHLQVGDAELRMFTTITSVGTPLDVTSSEVKVESFFPADEATETWLRALA